MTPDTIHLIAQMIRHARGMLTAAESWLSVQSTTEHESPGSPTASRTPRLATNGLPESNNAHTRVKGL